jgi:prevent-host-death family protein
LTIMVMTAYVPAMRTATVAELKARLSEFLAAAKRGEDVIVTERGRPVARLTALTGGAAAAARMERLVRSGLVRPPKEKLPSDYLDRPRPADPEGRVLDALAAERAEGW